MFNADEILAIAVKIEQNARDFYTRAAETVKDEGASKLFGELADWETSHIRLFSDMREKFSAQREALDAMDLDGEAAKYLQAIADGEIFKVAQTEADLDAMGDDPHGIIQVAIGREKDAVIFYTAMKDMVPETLGKSDIHKIIEEEMSHVRFLAEKARTL